ncbi:MAG TPA: hypothetical protein VGY56_22015 [Verrucomicrobiae bacterium]|nr:hypothetical protein [Verrucomicrobiae bacterium]
MKLCVKIAFVTSGVVVLLILFFAAPQIYEIFGFDTRKQMDADKKYMDSLTDKDIQAWIQRAQYYIKNPPTNDGMGPFPPELQKLGITGIEEQPGNVDFVWLGGMDDTALDVVQTSNGDFQVFAVYTPYTNRMIWPRQP